MDKPPLLLEQLLRSFAFGGEVLWGRIFKTDGVVVFVLDLFLKGSYLELEEVYPVLVPVGNLEVL